MPISNRISQNPAPNTALLPFRCPQCQLVFPSQYSYETHLSSHQREAQFTCVLCGATFPSFDQVQQHHFHHSQMASASQQQCVHCSSIFSSIHELIHHQLQGCESPSLPHLTDILSNVPIPTAGVNPLPPLRPVSFASLSAPLEQSDFSRTRSFTPTSSVASGEHDRPFASPNCNLAFSNQESLDKHSKHCRKTFLCVICGKEFTISGNLTRHLRTHSKQKKFQCGDCDKKFNRSDDLRRHQLSHSGAKNYKCSICGRKFAQSAHLSSHRNTHSIVKPYNCDKCHKGFTQLSALRKHNTVFHPQD